MSGALVLTGQALGGLGREDLFVLLAASLPALAAVMLLGRALHGRMPAHRFQRYVHLLVEGLGLVLVGKVLLAS